MRRNDELPRLVDGVNESGNQIRERFANAGTGFEEEGTVVPKRRRRGASHLLLLGAVVECQGVMQPTVFRKDLRGQFGRATLHRGRRRRVSIITKANHEREL